MSCSSTSQLTNASSVPLTLTRPQTDAQWAVFVQRLQDMLNATRDAAGKTGINVIPAAYALYDAPALPALTVTGATVALDGTKTQFGNASLKLTATAATVTLTFAGDPIKINPYQRWIESVYIQSSRAAIAGTLATVTAAASYPVDISGNLLPSTWGRLYGDCSLVADDSTAATLTLTLTGCSVGDTFNLEGWQLEQANGSTNLPSAFVNSAAPGSQDAVPDSSTYVRLDASHASNNVAYNYRGVWSSATAYVIGDEVVYSGSYWLALANSTNSAPAQGNGNWQVVGAYNNYQGAWSSTVTYYPGQEATYSGNYWVCATQNINSAPSTSNANWVIAGPQNLDKVPDGTARFAVVNGGGLNAVSAVDPNKKALIDFTQTGHTGKSLANIPDDPTSTRYAVGAIDGNRRALIDFSQSAHVNKTLDYIGDTGHYIRQPVTGIAVDIPNASFAQPVDAAGNIPAWSLTAGGVNASWYLNTSHGGNAELRSYVGAYAVAACNKQFSVKPGDSVWVGVMCVSLSGTSCGAVLRWFNAAGSAVGTQMNVLTTSGSMGLVQNSAVAPSGAAYFTLELDCAPPASGYAYADFLNIECRVNDVRVAGSGYQLGDQRNNKPLVAAGAASAYIASGGALTETYNSADNTYSVTQAAMNMQIGSQSIPYNSWTSPHLAPGTKYYFALNDPNWAGGSAPLVYSTAQTSTLNNDGYVTAANYTTGASGGGGGGGGGAGSGSGTCVALTAYLLPDVPASRARAGMRIDGAAGFKITGKTVITNVAFFTAPCVMVTAADGCQLPCSTTTPFTLPDGTTKNAPDMVGELVLTDLSSGGSKVTSVADLGSLPVVLITRQDNESYPAGVDAAKRIYSHNSMKN